MAIDFKGPLNFPTSGDNFNKLLIGGVLHFVPIVHLFAVGYCFTLMQKTMQHPPEEMPDWEKWGGYFKKGLMLTIINLCYILIPFIIMPIGGYFIDENHPGLGGSLLLLGILLLIPVFFLLPMAFLQYARNQKFSEAFALGPIKSMANHNDYKVLVLVMLGGLIGIGVVASIPLLGFFVAPFLTFYWTCVNALLFGNFYREHFGTPVTETGDGLTTEGGSAEN